MTKKVVTMPDNEIAVPIEEWTMEDWLEFWAGYYEER